MPPHSKKAIIPYCAFLVTPPHQASLKYTGAIKSVGFQEAFAQQSFQSPFTLLTRKARIDSTLLSSHQAPAIFRRF